MPTAQSGCAPSQRTVTSNPQTDSRANHENACPRIALLTAGRDKPYALGIAEALLAAGVQLDFIGSDEVRSPALLSNPSVQFLNLRGDQRADASIVQKIVRVVAYYLRLFGYVVISQPKIFHILWNNRFETLDRTFLMVFYRLLAKRVVLTAHNVNAAARDGHDSRFNRFTLKFQYRLCDHVFVHTERMKSELLQFGVSNDKVTVIPFGINNTVPNTALSPKQARERLGICQSDRVLLFFGNIAPYKGLEYLLDAFEILARESSRYRLVLAGRPKASREYWDKIQAALQRTEARGKIIQRFEFIPDEETEVYFKAADVLILPYTHIFQSGVLFLSYGFGLPVIACDVGALKDEIVEEETGFICAPQDPASLAASIRRFFSAALWQHPELQRAKIIGLANDRYSWRKVADRTRQVYRNIAERNVL